MAHRDQQQMARLFRINCIRPGTVQPQPAFLHGILCQVAVLQNSVCQRAQAAVILYERLLQSICREHPLHLLFSLFRKAFHFYNTPSPHFVTAKAAPMLPGAALFTVFLLPCNNIQSPWPQILPRRGRLRR